jgi:recombinational DNA repair ATPase RecF
MKLEVRNWRKFANLSLDLPDTSFVISDQNGAGKTSILAMLYSIYTGKAWPGTTHQDNLRVGSQYLGIQTELVDWNFLAQLNRTKRMTVKFERPTTDPIFHKSWPMILTYRPTDNLWLSQSRPTKLRELDALLGLIQVNYSHYISRLDRFIKSKQSLIRHCQETQTDPDWDLLDLTNREIHLLSKQIWNLRRVFWSHLESRLSQFSSWISSPLANWKIVWEITDYRGVRTNLDLIWSTLNGFSESEVINFGRKLWPKEVIVGQVLYGAQRDDFRILASDLDITRTFSRGEMRLFVLFLKQTGYHWFKVKQAAEGSEPILWWLLDDVFDELDSQREEILIQKVMVPTGRFVATTTKKLTGQSWYRVTDLVRKLNS